MPRVRRKAKQRTGITEADAFALCAGQDFFGDSYARTGKLDAAAMKADWASRTVKLAVWELFNDRVASGYNLHSEPWAVRKFGE